MYGKQLCALVFFWRPKPVFNYVLSVIHLSIDYGYSFFSFFRKMPKAERKTKNTSDNVIQDLNDIIGDFGGEEISQEEKELQQLEKLADEAEQAVLNISQPLSPISDNAAPLAPLVGSARAVTVPQEEKQKLSIDAAKSLQLIKDIKKEGYQLLKDVKKTPALAASSSSKQKAAPQSMPQLVGSQPKTPRSGVNAVWPPLNAVAKSSASSAVSSASSAVPRSIYTMNGRV